MSNANNPGKYIAVQFNVGGNMVDSFCDNDETVVAKWAKNHTEGAKRCVIYRAVLRSRQVNHVELEDFDNPEQKHLSV